MHITVTFRHIDSTDALKNYAIEKTGRLKKYLVDFEPVEIHWVLTVEKIRHITDVTIVANGMTIKAQESTQDLYSAIDMVIDKLEKQVIKHKEKIKNHKPGASEPGSIKYGTTEELSGEQEPEPGGRPRIVKTENVFVKPMSIEEATMQMDIIDNDFLVFTNSSTSNINVLYRRADGNYGLIEAQTSK